MFSLIDDPWILAVDSEGNQISVGIREVFSEEVNIAYLQGDSPAQNYAVLRLLLAIFWRAHLPESEVASGNTFRFSDWFEKTRDRLAAAHQDLVVLDYLDHYRKRFELLDSETPFMQVADLHVASGEIKHITTIVPESQDSYFTMRAGKARDSLSFAEAARWLIYVQAFDYSGIKSGAVGDSRVKGGRGYPIGTGWSGMTGGTIVKGSDLLDTLVLNTTIEAITNSQDRPVWERQPDGADSRQLIGEKLVPQGPADLATWQSRRIRLFPEGDRVIGVVVANGDKIPDAGANVLDDPMTPYRYSTNKSKKNLDVYYPRPYDVERTMWRSLDALIVSESDEGFSAKEKAPKRPKNLSSLAKLSDDNDDIPTVLDIDLISVVYGPQASSVATTFAASISMPVVLLLESARHLRRDVRSAVTATQNSAIALGQFAGNLLDAAGGDYVFQPAVTDQVLAELEPHFNRWLAQLGDITRKQARQQDSPLRARMVQWQGTVRNVIEEHARILLRGAGPKALVGRIEPKEGEKKPRVISAASYYRLLQLKLDKELPLTVKSQEEKEVSA